MIGTTVSCNKCGWVHFEVSAKYVHDWMRDWVEFWIKSTPETRGNYGCAKGPPAPNEYLGCHRCGETYKNFSETSEEKMKAVYGCTIGPILIRSQDI